MLTGPFEAQEALLILRTQLDNQATRLGALAWLDANYDALFARGAQDNFDRLPGWGDGGCSAEERTRFVAVFAQRVAKLDGGPRSYAEALERIELCIAYRAAQEPSLPAWHKAGAKRR